MVSTGWIDLVTAKRAKAVDVASPLGSNYLQRSYVFANRALLKVDHINDVTYRYKYKSIQDTADGDMAKRTSAVGRMKDARYDVNGLRERDKNGNRSVEYGMEISTSASAPFEFDEYGNALPGSGSGTGPSSPKTFVGGLSVNDDTADSGLFNMGHRNYAAGVLGRFISRDPIGYAGNLNLYAYPTNPVTFTDAAGLQPALPWPGQQSYPDQSPYAVTGQTKADVLWAIAKIESLRFPDQAKTLRGQLNSGELQLQRNSPYNVGFTNPLTGNISFDYDYCQSSGQTKEGRFVRLAALLFHESTHRSTQSRSYLGQTGFNAYFLSSSQAERTLERPIYSAERSLLMKWLQNESDPNTQSALKNNIARCDAAINRLDKEAAASQNPVKYIWTGPFPVPNQ